MAEHELEYVRTDEPDNSVQSPFLTEKGEEGKKSVDQEETALTIEEGRYPYPTDTTDQGFGQQSTYPEREEPITARRASFLAAAQGESAVDSGNPDTEQSSGRNMGEGGYGCIGCFLCLASVAALLIVVLVPLGFSDLEYYEMGFVKRKTTGTVDTSKVYHGGRYFVGVDKTFKKFKADAHIEVYNDLEIFNVEKIKVTMSCTLQYFIYPDELAFLHDTYDIRYRPVLKNTVLAAMKDAATEFTVNEYRSKRQVVAKALKEAAKEALGGTCCRTYCVNNTACTMESRGLFSELRYFQLKLVSITPEQQERFLTQVLEIEKQDTEKFKQKELLMRKETQRLKSIVVNEASEITQNATAKSNLISARADAEAKAITEDARNSGLKIIYDLLNITKPEHKKSFDYLRTLRNLNGANMYIGFKTIIAKPGQ